MEEKTSLPRKIGKIIDKYHLAIVIAITIAICTRVICFQLAWGTVILREALLETVRMLANLGLR